MKIQTIDHYETQGVCAECGALLIKGETCRSVFDSFLVLEFSDSAYGAVHMLTVACYMIQHACYSDNALAWIEKQLRDHLHGGIPVEQIRKQSGIAAQPASRSWKVTRQSGDPVLPKIAWSMTIMDVAQKYQNAAHYCALVKDWAQVTLNEMQPWLRSRICSSKG